GRINRRGLEPQPLISLSWRGELKSANAGNARRHVSLPKGHWMEALRAVKADDILVYSSEIPQLERFIYYDGLLPAPKALEIQVNGDHVSLKNQAKHPLLDVTIVDLRNVRKIRTAGVAKIEAEADVKEVKFSERDQTKWPNDGIDDLVGQLKSAGLNE